MALIAPPQVRVRRAPPFEPPFDDELPSERWPIPGVVQLALDWSSPGRTAGGMAAGSPTSPPPTRPPWVASSVEPAGGSPADARTAARRFTLRCLEILNGYRPPAHIRPLADPVLAAAIVERLATDRIRLAATQPVAHPGRIGSPSGAAVAGRPGGGRWELVRLAKLRLCEPRPGVAEIAAVVTTPRRAWALAFRLEHRRGAWLCTTTSLL